jgi:hypothetical protein
MIQFEGHRALVEEVRGKVHLGQVVIRPPFIMAEMHCAHQGRRFKGYGFSKQNRYGKRADSWNEARGLDIAKGKALGDLVRVIQEALVTQSVATQSGGPSEDVEEHAP